MKVSTAVIPVAGLGTRMLPATKAIPKELVAVVSKPAVQWVVEAAADAGIDEIILVTSEQKSAIERHFAADPELEAALDARGKASLLDGLRSLRARVRVRTAVQREPLGLGHAVSCAREAVGDQPFAILLPDELVLGRSALAQCLDVERSGGSDACVVGLARVPADEVSRYGIVRARPHDERTVVIEDLVEKPRREDAPSDLAVTGPYVLTPDVFDDLARVQPRAGGEIQLTDALSALARRRSLWGRLIEGERLDVGHPLGFVQANVALALEDPELGAPLAAWLRRRACS